MWMPIPSFDDILEANKDVLERIKEKGEKHTIPISIARFAIVCADALINELK